MPQNEMDRSVKPLFRLGAYLLPVLVALALAPASVEAARVQEVVSPGGVKAWLIESRTVPAVTMSISFKGGGSQDPDEKPGVANFASWMFNEGAGDMRTQELLRSLKRLGAAMDRDVNAAEQVIHFRALNKNRDEAFDLLRLMLTAPRFDEDAIARGRQEIIFGIEAANRDPGSILGREWSAALFGQHAYGRELKGTVESVAAISRQDLETYRRNAFARDNMIVAVVGDIDAAALAGLLDKVFGELPPKASLRPVSRAKATEPQHKLIQFDLAQSQVLFGYVLDNALSKQGILASEVLNQIVSGSQLTSRLGNEVRVKRGLVYSIGFSVRNSLHADYTWGYFGTDNAFVDKALAIVKDELRRLAEDGPTEQEIADAKSYLQGSFLLGLDTDPKLSNYLLRLQQFDYGPDSIDTYASRIEALTVAEIRRIAKETLKPDALTVFVAGRPQPN